MTLRIIEVDSEAEIGVLEDLIGLLSDHASGRLDSRVVAEGLVAALGEHSPAHFFIGYDLDASSGERTCPAVAVAANLCASALTGGRYLFVDHVALNTSLKDIRICAELLRYVMDWAARRDCHYVRTSVDRHDIVLQALFAEAGFGLGHDVVFMDAMLAHQPCADKAA